jgi:hypothetical protein
MLNTIAAQSELSYQVCACAAQLPAPKNKNKTVDAAARTQCPQPHCDLRQRVDQRTDRSPLSLSLPLSLSSFWTDEGLVGQTGWPLTGCFTLQPNTYIRSFGAAKSPQNLQTAAVCQTPTTTTKTALLAMSHANTHAAVQPHLCCVPLPLALGLLVLGTGASQEMSTASSHVAMTCNT